MTSAKIHLYGTVATGAAAGVDVEFNFYEAKLQ